MSFWKWVSSQISKAHQGEQNMVSPVRQNTLDIEDTRSMSFRLYFADGGAILQTRSCNVDKNGNLITGLFIIDANDNIAERIAQIVQTEIIRH